MGSYVPNTSSRVLGILVLFFSGWVAVRWVAAGSRLGGSRQAAATHPDGNGNGNDNGNDNGNGNELSGARYAPNQRAQGSHMPFGAPLSANHPHSDN